MILCDAARVQVMDESASDEAGGAGDHDATFCMQESSFSAAMRWLRVEDNVGS